MCLGRYDDEHYAVFISIVPSVLRSVTDLALVCAEFTEAFARQPLRLPSLERLLAYSGDGLQATIGSADRDIWQCELLVAMGVNDKAIFPSAATTWFGATGQWEQGAWLHADPVWMSMSAQGLTLDRVGSWSASLLQDVGALLQEHLADANMHWRVAGTHAFLHRVAPLEVRTIAPRQAARGELRESLPQGRDAAELRRLMTELQMLLHEKLPPSAPNAIWLWGAGSMPARHAAKSPPLWTDDAYARGVYALIGEGEASLLPASLDALLGATQAPRAIVVIRADELREVERSWFDPALRALHAGRVKTIDLYLDGRHARVKRSILKRWFARPRAMTEWFA